ncbi:hypothetical protein CRE_19735 [Caenorhabditis remanei]|uniref:F-box domain-containing protein n=1 Tax=Caenorhabditis remanei TaxID=31234 RepID=E3MTI4_CAERE|nr:hypothetical protein CRE_19735 [Caenorhabditis remanei]
MSEILKNNPTALRACIFYECRRTKNVEEAFKNFCEAIGDDLIDYVGFEYWFDRFYQGNLDFDHDRSTDRQALILTDLTLEMLNEIIGNLDIRNSDSRQIMEILKNNPTALRACIFYEFLRNNNVEKAYKNFCKTVGVDVIDYVDFEYWFYRFYNGNLDFYQDRSTDPKPLILTDLPMEMLNEIVGYLDLPNRFNVRKVSRKFEKVVDRFKSEYDDITIYIETQEVKFNLDDYFVHYENGQNDCYVQFDEADENQLNIELSALPTVLTTSKSLINCFWITTYDPEAIDVMPKLIDALSKEVSPVFYAKTVVLYAQHNDYVIPILLLFKTGVLEELQLEDIKPDDDTFAKLVEIDQFKRLKAFIMFRKPIPFSQFKKLSHLATIAVYLDRVSAEDIVILRDILLQFVNLKSAHISLINPMNLSEFSTAFGIDYDNSGQIICSHPIPNSDKMLILDIVNCSIEVTIEND